MSSSAGSSAASSAPTNTAGRAAITVDPCAIVPPNIIKQQHLDTKPPEPDKQTDGKIENLFCGYLSPNWYFVTVSASNYTLEMIKQTTNHWGFEEFEINGRRALSSYTSPQPKTDACVIDVEATTGVYGVIIGTIHNDFTPYPDCLTAAHANLEAFIPYFPL